MSTSGLLVMMIFSHEARAAAPIRSLRRDWATTLVAAFNDKDKEMVWAVREKVR